MAAAWVAHFCVPDQCQSPHLTVGFRLIKLTNSLTAAHVVFASASVPYCSARDLNE
jgi:hypothetical protein